MRLTPAILRAMEHADTERAAQSYAEHAARSWAIARRSAGLPVTMRGYRNILAMARAHFKANARKCYFMVPDAGHMEGVS